MSYLGCSVRLYPQLFVGGLMSYLGCSVRLYPQLFVGGLMCHKVLQKCNTWYISRR
jgi:hypothetical protein